VCCAMARWIAVCSLIAAVPAAAGAAAGAPSVAVAADAPSRRAGQHVSAIVLVFDNRGRATTSNPSPEPVTVPLMVQDRLALADALLSRGSI
jgi:hypothetical protein